MSWGSPQWVFSWPFHRFGSHVYVLNPFLFEFCSCCETRVCFHSFMCRHSVFPTQFIKMTVLSLLCILATFVKHHLWIKCVGLFLGCLFLMLVCVSVYTVVQCCFRSCSCIVHFKARQCKASRLVLFHFKANLAIRDLLWFCMNLRIALFVLCFSISVKNISGILLVLCLIEYGHLSNIYSSSL